MAEVTRINATTDVSKIGFLVKQSETKTDSIVYVSSNSTGALGVIAEKADYRKPCRVILNGEALVYVNDNVVRGDIIRSQKTTDNISIGSCRVAKITDIPYLKIGVALENGRGLVRTSVSIEFINTKSTGDFQPLNTDLTRLADYRRIGGDANYTQFEADGTPVFVGDATMWDDMRIVPTVFDIAGGTDPDVISYQPGGSGTTFKVYAFAKGDSGYFMLQLPHGYKEGSDIFAHVHWTPGPRGVAENGNIVKWALDYSFISKENNFPASTTADLGDACDGTNHKHQITPYVAISGVGLTISSQMIGRVYRQNIAGDTWAGTGNDLPIFLEIDFHVNLDMVGSRTSSTK